MVRINDQGEFEWTCKQCGKQIKTDKLGPEFEIARVAGRYVSVLAINCVEPDDNEHVHGFAFALTDDRAAELATQLIETMAFAELMNARQARSN